MSTRFLNLISRQRGHKNLFPCVSCPQHWQALLTFWYRGFGFFWYRWLYVAWYFADLTFWHSGLSGQYFVFDALVFISDLQWWHFVIRSLRIAMMSLHLFLCFSLNEKGRLPFLERVHHSLYIRFGQLCIFHPDCKLQCKDLFLTLHKKNSLEVYLHSVNDDSYCFLTPWLISEVLKDNLFLLPSISVRILKSV